MGDRTPWRLGCARTGGQEGSVSTSGEPGASREMVAEARGRTAGWGPLNRWVLELWPPRETGEGSGSGNSSEAKVAGARKELVLGEAEPGHPVCWSPPLADACGGSDSRPGGTQAVGMMFRFPRELGPRGRVGAPLGGGGRRRIPGGTSERGWPQSPSCLPAGPATQNGYRPGRHLLGL